ncbi:MAG: hypothetical protein H0U63_04620 [Burkholderiales bacterium]|nr:hypothetical protein [Burkholderiales bacterium]
MATLTATRAGANFPVAGHGFGGALKVAWGTYTLAANPTAADIVRFCRVPAYATVIGGWLMGADIDTGTGVFDFDIGWEDNGTDVADPDGFGNMGALNGTAVTNYAPAGGILIPLQGVLLTAGPKTFAAETIISGTVITAANAGGTGVLTVRVDYMLE